MYVRSPISADYITAGKLYEAYKVDENLAIIIDDYGKSRIIRLSSCAHLRGRDWEIVPTDPLTKEKETPMTDERTPIEIAYDAALAALNLKEGDLVTVTREWSNYHLGWNNSWEEEMADFLGKPCTVVRVALKRRGIRLSWEGGEIDYCFPPYVLKKLADAPKKPEPVPTTEPELMASDITLRDYFAAQALTDLAYGDDNLEETATLCYTLADAMLEARKKK